MPDMPPLDGPALAVVGDDQVVRRFLLEALGKRPAAVHDRLSGVALSPAVAEAPGDDDLLAVEGV